MSEHDKAVFNKSVIDFARDTLGLDIPPGVVSVNIDANFERYPYIIFKTLDPVDPTKIVKLADGSTVSTANFKTVKASMAPELCPDCGDPLLGCIVCPTCELTEKL